ncbi:O-antigen polymerase [Paenibacillus sp. HJGM_3]|uniref:O-antigen polymerase n=1 Tax=Paenibacillus sp. HJGM_3 TaxID=3379816 RepID=UPI003869426C
MKKSMFFVYFFMGIATLIQLLLDSSVISILSFIILTFICFYSIDFDILHPFVWFVPVFTIYSISFPLLFILGATEYYFTKETLLLEWLALCVFIVTTGNKQVSYNKLLLTKKSELIIVILYVVTILLTLLQVIFIVSLGYTTKISIAQSNNFFIVMGRFASNGLIIPSIFLYLQPKATAKIRIWHFSIGLMVLSLAFLASGDRSVVLKYILTYVFLYNVTYKKIKISTFTVMGILGLSLVAIMSPLKMFIANGFIAVTSPERSFFIDILYSEFYAASFNLNYLLLMQDLWNYRLGSTLIYDLLSPFDLLNVNPFNINNFSAVYWNQSTFWKTSTSGMGFTLVGEGYLNFGIIGIVIWYVFIALFVKWFYFKSNKSNYRFVLYLLLISVMLYSNRADLANIFSPFFKYGILPIVLIEIITNIKRKQKQGVNFL